ncbi:unnamed protein product [Rhodiola kirilowii]
MWRINLWYLILTRQVDGLTAWLRRKQVYSMSIEFDRQELRKLVRNVQAIQEQQGNIDENNGELDLKLMRAQKSLNHFLCSLAKYMPTD